MAKSTSKSKLINTHSVADVLHSERGDISNSESYENLASQSDDMDEIFKRLKKQSERVKRARA